MFLLCEDISPHLHQNLPRRFRPSIYLHRIAPSAILRTFGSLLPDWVKANAHTSYLSFFQSDKLYHGQIKKYSRNSEHLFFLAAISFRTKPAGSEGTCITECPSGILFFSDLFSFSWPISLAAAWGLKHFLEAYRMCSSNHLTSCLSTAYNQNFSYFYPAFYNLCSGDFPC